MPRHTHPGRKRTRRRDWRREAKRKRERHKTQFIGKLPLLAARDNEDNNMKVTEADLEYPQYEAVRETLQLLDAIGNGDRTYSIQDCRLAAARLRAMLGDGND